MLLFIQLAVIISVQAQDRVKIGELKNGKLVVTNVEALKAYFVKSLEKSGTLGKDYLTIFSPEGDRCIIFYPVSGNTKKINTIGVMLVKSKNDFFIIKDGSSIETVPGGGGSIEFQCIGGDGCITCVPNVKWPSGEWMPAVFCECQSPVGGDCTMTSRIVIQIQL